MYLAGHQTEHENKIISDFFITNSLTKVMVPTPL